MRARLLFIALLALTFFLAPLASAQVADPMVAAQAPQPGSGHHYMGSGSDTVNPADGSLTFNLPIPTPPGRGISFPFGIRYSSSEQYSLTAFHGGPAVWWTGRPTTPWGSNAWTYDLPALIATARVLTIRPYTVGGTTVGWYQCDASYNYVFRGFGGTQYTIGLGGEWDDPNNLSGACTLNPPVGSSFGHGVSASANGGSIWTQWPYQPPVNVTDQSGAVYQFPQYGVSVSVPQNGPAPVWGLLAQSITDRNGNQITLNPGGNGYIDTLGRTVVTWSSQPGNAGQITVSGLGAAYQLSSQSVTTTFPENVTPAGGLTVCPLQGSGTSTTTSISQIVLPNGKAYTFGYDSTYGHVNQITFPDGGSVRYSWNLNTNSAGAAFPYNTQSGSGTCYVRFDTPAITDRWVNDGSRDVLHQVFSYATPTWDATYPYLWTSKTTTVTTYDLVAGTTTITKYTYTWRPPDQGGQFDPVCCLGTSTPRIPVEQAVQYQDGSGNTKKTVNKTWANTYSMAAEQTVLDNGQGATRLFCGEPVTDLYEYGFQSEGLYPGDPSCYTSSNPTTGLNTSALGPLRRHTVTVYAAVPGQQPASVTVYDGSGNVAKQTNYSYDQTALQASGAINLAGPPGSSRGNATTVQRLVNGTTFATSTYSYYDTGHVYQMTDACGNTACSDMTGSNHTTTYSYADSFAAGTGTPTGQTNAYLTQVTYPNTGAAHSENLSWGYNDGLIRSGTDENSQITTYTYNTPPAGCNFPDGLNRLSAVTYPDTGKVTYCYNDTSYNSSTPSPSVTTTKAITSTTNLATLTAFNGLGTTVRSALTSDPDCASGDRTDTTYDGLGRVFTVSNPYCSTSDPTYGITTNVYDPLGRPASVTLQDGSVTTTSYSGNCTTVTDPAGRVRKSCVDSLGRLIEVDEPGTGAQLATSGSGQLTVTGAEQSKTTGATHSTGSITISGASSSSQSVTVGTYTCHFTFPITGVPASQMASAVASCLNGHLVTATASSNVVSLTSIATGSSTNYSISVSGFSGTHSGMSGGTDGTTTYDTGTLTVTVNGFPASASYGSSSTPTTIASALATALSVSGSPVTATSSAATITLNARAVGSGTNYSVSTSVTWNSSNFTSASFNFQAPVISALSGGSDATFGTTPLITAYTYDVLDNLLTVNQKGGNTDSTQWRPRTFTYDSLSRLTSSTNPESNTQPVSPFTLVPTTYAYDANGNLSTKTSPTPNQTGTATVTATYNYDVLNRITQKSFSDGTPTVKYGYDGVTLTGCATAPPPLTIGNGIGRRTAMCDAAGAESWSYDITANVGWKTTDARSTNGVTKTTIAQNNLLGSLASLTYPSGRVINYAFDSAARALSATDSTGPINYATAATYAPQGALASLTNATSLISTLFYNSRLQPCRISVKSSGTAPTTCTSTGAGNLLDFTYGFNLGSADNGNLASITNNRDNTRSQNFTYDALNRIASAQTQTSGVTIPNSNCWGLTFGYDPWGNLLQQTLSGPAGCGEPLPLNVTATTANRISGYCYDTAGNLLDQAACPAPPHAYTYNAENQLTTTAGVTYTYDGDGKRVKKSNGKLYWYGISADPLDETDLAGNTNNSSFFEYVFFGSRRIARRDSTNAVNYYFADHLGTSRVVTNSSGSILDDSDFYPFGGERPACEPNGAPGCTLPPGSGNNYKFTGKERDSETGLDNFGARYNSSSFGRFLSADSPSYSNHKNPQSWNLYAYGLNNPVTLRDADGHEVVCANNPQQCQKDAAAATANAEAAKRVTTNTVTTKHSFLGIHWTTSKTTIAISGDINSFRSLSTNAAKLADLVTTNKTVTVSYADNNRPLLTHWDTASSLHGGSGSDPRIGAAVIDPTRTEGVIYDQDAIDNNVPQSNTAEEFAHEVLGHIWGDWFGGAAAGTKGNMRDSIAAENAVRALDPTRGQKGLTSHHNYREAPDPKGPDD